MSGGMTSMSIDFPELDVLKDMPGFKAIMRALLKQQIQQLVEQLANHTGDECIVLTASVTDGTLCHLGTRAGKHFLNSRDEIKSQFLRHCLKRQESQLPQDSTNISPLHSNIEEPVLNKTIPDIFPRKRRRCGSNSNAFLNSQTSQRDVGKTIQNAEPVSRNSHGLSSFHQKHQQGDHNSAKQSRLSSTGVSLPTETQSWQFQNQHTSQLTGQSPHMSEGGVQNLSSEMIELSSDDEGHEIKTERDLDTKQQAKDRNHSSVSLAGSNMAAPKLTVTGSFSTAASNTSMPSASSASSSKMIDLFSSTANRAFQGKEGMPVSASSSSQRAESVDISKIKSEPVDESSIQSELLGEGNTTGLSETDWLQNVTTGMDFQLTMQPGTANSSQADGFVSSAVSDDVLIKMDVLDKPPVEKKPRKRITLETKRALIFMAESSPTPSRALLRKKFGIGKSTVGDILKRKEFYKKQYEKLYNRDKTRGTVSSKYDKVNNLVWQWYCDKREKKVPLNGGVLKRQAAYIAKELGFNDFKGSNGWLDSWKYRYAVKSFKYSATESRIDKE